MTTEAPAGGGESEADIIAELSQQASAQASESRAQRASEPRESDEREASDQPEQTAGEAPERGDEADELGEDEPAEVEETEPPQTGHDSELSADERLRQAHAALEKGDVEKAFLLALGHKPEYFQVNAGKFTALRQSQRREREKLDRDRQQLVAHHRELNNQVQLTLQRLAPYEKYYEAEQKFKRDRDTRHLRTIVEGVSGLSYDEAQKAMLRDARASPTETRLQRELEELKSKLADVEKQREQQGQQRTAEQQKQADLAVIQQQLGGHEVAEVPNYVERVYRVLAKHYDARLGGLTITVEDAARAVMRGERRRVEKSPLYRRVVKRDSAPEPAKKPASASKPLRRDSQSNGAHVGDESFDDIVNDIQSQIERQKQRGRRASG